MEKNQIDLTALYKDLDYEADNTRFKLVLGAHNGVGKTTMALTFPKIHLIAFSNNYISGWQNCRKLGFTPDLVAITRPEDVIDKVGTQKFYDKTVMYQRLKEAFRLALEDEECDTVILDDLTAAYEMIHWQYKDELVQDKKNSFNHWNMIIKELQELFGYFAISPKNVIILCHWDIKDVPGQGKQWCPKINTHYAFTLATDIQNCWNLEIDYNDNNKRLLVTRPNSSFTIIKSPEQGEPLYIPKDPALIYPLLIKHGLVPTIGKA